MKLFAPLPEEKKKKKKLSFFKPGIVDPVETPTQIWINPKNCLIPPLGTKRMAWNFSCFPVPGTVGTSSRSQTLAFHWKSFSSWWIHVVDGLRRRSGHWCPCVSSAWEKHHRLFLTQSLNPALEGNVGGNTWNSWNSDIFFPFYLQPVVTNPCFFQFHPSGTISLIPGCFKFHPTWPCTFPEMG